MATRRGIKVDKLVDAIAETLEEYSRATTSAVHRAIDDTAERVAADITAGAPRRTGQYAPSWEAEGFEQRKSGYKQVVHATEPHYRLAHLLEKPHKWRDGSVSTPQPHIKPAVEAGEAYLMERIEEAIKRG